MKKLAIGAMALYVAITALAVLIVGLEDEDEYDTLYLNPRGF